MKLTEALKRHATETFGVKAEASEDEFTKAVGDAVVGGTLTPQKFAELTADPQSVVAAMKADIVKEVKAQLGHDGGNGNGRPTMVGLLSDFGRRGGGDNADHNIRVKNAVEQYDSSRKRAIYPTHTKAGTPHQLAGQAASHMGTPLDEPSERDL